MKQYREPFLFQALENYFHCDSAHHFKSTEWQIELQELRSSINYFTKEGRGIQSLLHGKRSYQST